MSEMTLEEAVRVLDAITFSAFVATAPEQKALAVLKAHAARTLAARAGEPEWVRVVRDDVRDHPEAHYSEEIGVVCFGHARDVVEYIDTLTARLDAVTRERDALRARLADIDAACLEVCRDNTPAVHGGEPDESVGRFLCLNEHGDELIDTDDAAEVVRALTWLWGRTSERLSEMQAERDALRTRMREMLHGTFWHEDDAFLAAVQDAANGHAGYDPESEPDMRPGLDEFVLGVRDALHDRFPEAP